MGSGSAETAADEPLVSCRLQGGTLSVYADRIVIDRSSASIHADKTIPLDEVRDVTFEAGLLTGHVQVEQVGVEPAEAGLLSQPVDENTLYVSRGKRSCARDARDAILEQMSGA